MPSDCPSAQAVADFVARRLEARPAGDLERHLDDCIDCRELVSALARTGGDGESTVPAAGGVRDVTEEAPVRVGRFIVSERLGAGGMGVVYAAHDPTLDRRVALKLLHGEYDGGRLLREAQAAAQLAHPNVVAVYEVGEHHGRVFLAMELVEGDTLTRWLRERPRQWRAIREVLLQAGRGLAAAHHAGFVHRDFKPDNVLVGRDGRARVTDFGLARLDEVAATTAPSESAAVGERTRTTVLAGTPAYMAPEQLHGRAVDARADQFAFCVTVFEALAGVRPFAGRDVGELRAAIDGGTIRAATGDEPAAVRRALRRGLAVAPAARHPSMDALLAVLARDPPRWGRRVLLAMAVAVAIAAVWWARAGSAAAVAPCGGAQARLDTVWNPGARAGAHQAFAATGKPFAEDAWHAVERGLDDYATRWVAGHEDACTATAVRHEQSAELLDLRMSCLDSRLEELRSVAALLAGADAALVERAASVASSLSDLAACADRERLLAAIPPPRDPAGIIAKAEIDRRLAVANALLATGKVSEAIAAASVAVAEARRLGHPPTLALALMRLGLGQMAGDVPDARATFREAARTAEAARADDIRVDALTSLVHIAADPRQAQGANGDGAHLQGDRYDDAIGLAEDAFAALRRLGGDIRRETTLLVDVAMLYRNADRPSEAKDALSRARALAERADPPDNYELARVLGELGWVTYDEGHVADALVLFRRAHRVLEDAVGASHPEIATALYNLALMLYEQGLFGEARANHERALAMQEAMYGLDALIVGVTLRALGETMTALGQAQEGLPLIARARAIFAGHGEEDPSMLLALGNAEAELGRFADAGRHEEEAHAKILALFGPDDGDVATAHFHLGHLRTMSGELDRALAHYREMLRIDELLVAATSPTLVMDLALVGEIEVRLGHPAVALPILERAVTLAAAAPEDRREHAAAARFYLARALDALGRDPDRARSLAEAALAYFASAEVPGPRASIEAWLAARP